MENTPNLDDFDKVFGPQSTGRIDLSQDPKSTSPAVMESTHSPVGKASFILAMVYPALVLSIFIEGNLGLTILCGILAIGCSIVGLILGIIGLSDRKHKRGLAIAGTILNGLFVLALLVIILVMLAEVF